MDYDPRVRGLGDLQKKRIKEKKFWLYFSASPYIWLISLYRALVLTTFLLTMITGHNRKDLFITEL